MSFPDEIMVQVVEKFRNHVSDTVQETGCASILLDSGVIFGININKFEEDGKSCLIITDSNGGRVCIDDSDAFELYVFLHQCEKFLSY